MCRTNRAPILEEMQTNVGLARSTFGDLQEENQVDHHIGIGRSMDLWISIRQGWLSKAESSWMPFDDGHGRLNEDGLLFLRPARRYRRRRRGTVLERRLAFTHLRTGQGIETSDYNDQSLCCFVHERLTAGSYVDRRSYPSMRRRCCAR